MSWVDELGAEDRAGWDEFVRHFREDALKKMDESNYVISLVPGEFDVKFAAELGTAIMLDKPILAIAQPGAEISGKLRQVADHVIEADIDTEAGREQVRLVLLKLTGLG